MINCVYLSDLCREYNDIDEKIHKLVTSVNTDIDKTGIIWFKRPDLYHNCASAQMVGQLKAMKRYRGWLGSRINTYLTTRECDDA